MKTLVQKLSSRKLWAAIAGIVTGLALVFGLDQNVISTVSGAVVAISSVVAYINAEGRIDAAAVKAAVEATQRAGEALAGDTSSGAARQLPLKGKPVEEATNNEYGDT